MSLYDLRCADFSDEELGQCTPDFREIYAAGRFLETKNREYWNALIAQQKEFGSMLRTKRR
jgi:hypothetical protein